MRWSLVAGSLSSWWRHRMETFSALLALCAGNSPVPVNSPHKGQWRGALMFSLICAWINDWVNNCEAGDWRRRRGHYDVNVMHIKGNRHSDFELTTDITDIARASSILTDSISEKTLPYCNGTTLIEVVTWRRHNMETFSWLLSLYEGNPLVAGGFPSQRDSNPALWSITATCWERNVHFITSSVIFMFHQPISRKIADYRIRHDSFNIMISGHVS